MSASIITIKDKQVSASYYFDDVKKIPEKIRTTLEDLLDITSSDGRRSKYKIIEYERIFRKSVKCSVEGDYVYGNRIVSFVPAEKSEKEYYKKNMVYLNESGIRRYISWLIIIGDFITTLAENFEIHNREFLKLEGKEVGHNIGKLLRKAKELAREYDHYFNVRNITDLEMRDLYEIMRENVGINEDRNFIDKRLEMLQSSDIVANNRKLQISIIFFTLVTVLEVFFRDINYPLLNQVAVYSIISLIFFIYILDYHRLGFIFKYIFRIIRGR